MRLLYIADTKAFMSSLLKSVLFDGFEARGIVLQTFTRFEISCVREDTEVSEKTRYCLWSEVKEPVFNIIKGKTPPKYMKICLCLSREGAQAIHQNAAALHLTLTYENGAVSVLTGAAQKNFSLEKDADSAWDTYALELLSRNGIAARESGE